MKRTKRTKTVEEIKPPQKPPQKIENNPLFDLYASEGVFLLINKAVLRHYGPEPAVFIANLIDKCKYFIERGIDDNGWFYQTHSLQMEETGLSEHAIRDCKKKFSAEGVLFIERRGLPSREWYQIDIERLHAILQGGTTKQLGGQRKSSKDTVNPHDNETKQSRKPSIKERNAKYLPLAEQLSETIKKKKNIRFTSAQTSQWADEIRKLVETNGVPLERVQIVLDWYENAIGGEYVPVVESGKSLRDKFIRLEEAMRREQKSVKTTTQPAQSQFTRTGTEIIQMGAPNPKIAQVLKQQCYYPAKELFPDYELEDTSRLAENILRMYDDILDIQCNFKGNSETACYTNTAFDIIEDYVEWLKESKWIENKSPDLFNVKHRLFQRFRYHHAAKANNEHDPITGEDR